MNYSRNTYLILGIIAIAVGITGLIVIFYLYGTGNVAPFGGPFGGHCPLCGRGAPGFRGFGGRGSRGFGKAPLGSTNFKSAERVAKSYISGVKGIKLEEMIEFDDSFEAEYKESKTGIGAFEIIIDKSSGTVLPEMGPNMMWNTKYGMTNRFRGFGLRGKTNNKLSISIDQAKSIASNYVKSNGIDMSVGQPEVWYGYYEFHLLKGNKPGAQIDVNGLNGDVWYEDWHGPILAIKEF